MFIFKNKILFELSINVLVLSVPSFLIINGIIGIIENDPNHPDVLILFEMLIIGILGLVMSILTVFRLFTRGWRALLLYQKLLAIFYLTCIIIGGFV